MNKTQTLADKISTLLSTTPASFDPEDEINEETAAKVTEGAFEEDDTEEVALSRFRKKNIEILEDVDIKYSGKKGNRKDFKESDEEFDTESEIENDSVSGDDDDFEEEEDSGEDEESNNSDDDDDEKDESEDEDGMSIDGDDHNFKHIKEENVSGQLKKGLCIRTQLNIWENLLEMRIQMQKCLVASNKMPQKESYNQFLEHADFKKKVNETKNSLSNTLNKLLELQNVVWKKYPDTKNLLNPSKSAPKTEGNESDEEIPSDSDVESDHDESEDEIKPPKKRVKLLDYEKVLDERHKNYQDYRNSTIQKWNDKTRIGSKSDLQHSVLNQINHILTDRSRLIKRTQTKRSNYEIIGEKDSEKIASENDDEDKHEDLLNMEIFDDDDFYHQLLRELIEVKSADLTDPVQLGRQWIQLQNLRSKMKRKIDTKATKGRKIRYTVHSKLVNFMAPIDEGSYTEEAKVELFSSLCGKNEIVHKS